MLRSLAVAATLTGSLLATSAFAQGAADAVSIDDPWARASIAPGRPSAAYMKVENTSGEDIVLTGARTDAAMMVDIHVTETDANGVSGMRPVGPIVIEPGGVAVLEPGGLHVMLMKLAAPLEDGQTVELVLEFEDGAELSVAVPVRAAK